MLSMMLILSFPGGLLFFLLSDLFFDIPTVYTYILFFSLVWGFYNWIHSMVLDNSTFIRREGNHNLRLNTGQSSRWQEP